MEIQVQKITDWDRVKLACLYTIGKSIILNKPTDEWKKKIIASEHSPLRELLFSIELKEMPYWLANEIKTHYVGCNSYMQSTRDDRRYNIVERGKLPQDNPVNMLMTINAQELINISRKRLCGKATKEAQDLWATICKKIVEIEPLFNDFLQRDCVYKNGCCTEFQPCKHFNKRINYIENGAAIS